MSDRDLLNARARLHQAEAEEVVRERRCNGGLHVEPDGETVQRVVWCGKQVEYVIDDGTGFQCFVCGEHLDDRFFITDAVRFLMHCHHPTLYVMLPFVPVATDATRTLIIKQPAPAILDDGARALPPRPQTEAARLDRFMLAHRKPWEPD